MNAAESLIEKVTAKVQEVERIRAAMFEEVKGNFSAIADEFFRETPIIGCVRWTQYTPYFNDGDSCTFNVHNFWFVSKATMESDDYYPYGYAEEFDMDIPNKFDASWKDSQDLAYPQYSWDKGTKAEYYNQTMKMFGAETVEDISKAAEGITKFRKFLSSLPENCYLNMFGDHVQVTLSPGKVEVEEYRHD